jgi:hypothetical protein
VAVDGVEAAVVEVADIEQLPDFLYLIMFL